MTKWRALCAALLLTMCTSSQAAVKAWVDNNHIAPGDTVQLTLQHDGQSNDQPDLAPLKQDFDILSTSHGSNMQIVNGSVSSQVQLQLTLSPKHDGQLQIPAIAWGNERSDPMSITVSTSAAGNDQISDASTPAGKVFITTAVDEHQPYVQAAVSLTVRVFTAATLSQADLELPTSNDLLVQQVGSDTNGTVVRDGKRYQMLERHYLVFPQRSGTLTLPGAVLDAQIVVRNGNDPFNDFFGKDFLGQSPFDNLVGTTKPIRVHGDALTLNVKPRPATAAGNYWLPARNVTLTASWHPDQLQAHVGDPLTVDLQLKAEGLTAAQLPDLNSLWQLPAGIKAYPDQAKLDNTAQGNTVVGTREQSMALIADQAGRFTVPALHLNWWDTQTNQPRELSMPARTLTILPASGTVSTQSAAASIAAPTTAPTNSTGTRSNVAVPSQRVTPSSAFIWQGISAGLGALWLITLSAWYWSQRRGRGAPTAATMQPHDATTGQLSAMQAHNAFKEACRRNDANAARRSLLAWIAAEYSNAGLTGLRALARIINDAPLEALLLELDRACYASGNWDGSALSAALPKLPRLHEASARKQQTILAALYE